MRLPRWLAAPVRRGFFDELTARGDHEVEISTLLQGHMAPSPGQQLDCGLTVMGFTNRCGSNLLADYLVQTGRFGGFGEVLNPPVIKAGKERDGVESLPDHMIALARRLNCGPGRNLGVKASADQLAMLIRHGIPAMFTGFRVVHVWRQDLLEQAVSFAIANRTKRWTTRQKAPSREVGNMTLDPVQIERMMRAIQQANNRIEAMVSVLGIPHASLSYEELTAAPGQAILRICTALGEDLGKWRPRAPKIDKQADALNARLVAEYRAMAQKCLSGQN